MLKASSSGLARTLTSRALKLSTSARIHAPKPNTPLDLDPSLQQLLKDVDISLARHKADTAAEHSAIAARRQLEVHVDDATPVDTTEALEDDYSYESRETRKSPAALFGSKRTGATILPLELTNAISRLIEAADRSVLHADAERLFLEDVGGGKKEWDATYDKEYKTRKQARRHAERDGTAFASVALPAHFSAIAAVFDHLAHRLGPGWTVDRVVDWHAGTGSGLWAALNAFQTSAGREMEDSNINTSTVSNYIAIEQRDGLKTIGKRLLEDISIEGLNVAWQKSFREEDRLPRSDGGDTIALSAFALSSLSSPLARKTLLKEMWQSGADVIVLIDHNNLAGFENIAEARQELLRMGRREIEDPETVSWPVKGSHVVAPCPHDGACPLYHPGSTKLVCGFSQRIQRPAFVRKTKHSGVGHEDIGYSYVVVRRGQRPEQLPAGTPKVGRLGQVGKREVQKQIDAQMKPAHRAIHEADLLMLEQPQTSTAESSTSQAPQLGGESEQTDVSAPDNISTPTRIDAASDIEEALRLEAYAWPRLVFPPLKRSGHVIIDCCTPEAKIMRHTIPKSQGKQAYYDARKSEWGDIFPHPPKNTPQERHVPTRERRKGKTTPIKGADIGKRGVDVTRQKNRVSYSAVAEEVKERKKQLRRERTMNKELF